MINFIRSGAFKKNYNLIQKRIILHQPYYGLSTDK